MGILYITGREAEGEKERTKLGRMEAGNKWRKPERKKRDWVKEAWYGEQSGEGADGEGSGYSSTCYMKGASYFTHLTSPLLLHLFFFLILHSVL